MTIKVEIVKKPDAAALSTVHKASFEKGWDGPSIAGMLAIKGTAACIACPLPGEKRILGFALLRSLGEEAELLTLAVSPEQQGRRIGTAIMQFLSAWARHEGAASLFLEVSEHNTAALKLYNRQGFMLTSRRKAYYANPDGSSSDALVMRLSL